jgi:methyl-accepting chemotaxis protein
MWKVPTQPYKRNLKNLLINPKYQLRYVFWLTSSGFALVALNGLIAFSFIKENYLTLVDLSPMTDEAKTQLYAELRQLIFSLSALSILFMAVISVMGVMLSHRTAGPMYHFKRVFDEIRSGNRKQRVRLRPKDEFQDVAKSFNDMMDSLQNPS